jgi:hypothetical protein
MPALQPVVVWKSNEAGSPVGVAEGDGAAGEGEGAAGEGEGAAGEDDGAAGVGVAAAGVGVAAAGVGDAAAGEGEGGTGKGVLGVVMKVTWLEFGPRPILLMAWTYTSQLVSGEIPSTVIPVEVVMNE